jgi:hypothetical protein
LQRVPRLLLEHAVTALGERLVQIGRALLEQVAHAGAPHLRVVRLNLAAAIQLAGDRGLLVDEQHHDVNRRLAEMDAEGRAVEFAAQLLHVRDEHLETLDLDLGARKAVEDHPVAVFGPQQLAEQQADHLAVAHHVAGILEAFGLGRVEQRTHHDRLAGETAGLRMKLVLVPLPAPGAPPSRMISLGKRRFSRP